MENVIIFALRKMLFYRNNLLPIKKHLNETHETIIYNRQKQFAKEYKEIWSVMTNDEKKLGLEFYIEFMDGKKKLKNQIVHIFL